MRIKTPISALRNENEISGCGEKPYYHIENVTSTKLKMFWCDNGVFALQSKFAMIARRDVINCFFFVFSILMTHIDNVILKLNHFHLFLLAER